MASRENHREPSRQVLCAFPVKQTACSVFQPAFQVYGYRKKETKRGLWSFEDNSPETHTADPAQHLDTRVESVINAFNINFDAMPMGKALRTKKAMRSPSKGQDDTHQNSAKKIQFTQESLSTQISVGSPDKRTYPPTPYIDRRRLPPRKPKHDEKDENSNLKVQGTSAEPVSPTSMYMEQPKSPTSKCLKEPIDAEESPLASPKKTTCLRVQELLLKEDFQLFTDANDSRKGTSLRAISKFNPGGERVSPQKTHLQKDHHKASGESKEPVKFINLTHSYLIDHNYVADIGKNENLNTNNYPDLSDSDQTNDANSSNNHVGDSGHVPWSKGIDDLAHQLLDEVVRQDLSKVDIEDTIDKFVSSSEDREKYAKIAQRVINALPSVSPNREDQNNGTTVNIDHTKCGPWVEETECVNPVKQAWTKDIFVHGSNSETSNSSETLVAGSLCSVNVSDVEEYQDSAEFLGAHWRKSGTESDSSAPASYSGSFQRSPNRSTKAERTDHQRWSYSPRENINQEMAKNNSAHGNSDSDADLPTSSPQLSNLDAYRIKTAMELILKENQNANVETTDYSSQSNTKENPNMALDMSASNQSLDLSRAYGIVQKSPQKKSAQQREELRGFFQSARGPVPTNQQSHFAKSGNFLYHLFKHGKLADVHIRLHNQSFRAHSAVLAAHSDYLACLLLNEGTPIYHLQLRDCITPAALTILLEYMYTGELDIKAHTVVEVLSATLALQMKAEGEQCRQYIENVEPSKLLMMWLQALEHNLTEDAANLLKGNATNFLKVITLQDFLLLPLKRVIDLLSREDLHITTELDVAKAGMRWLQYDLESRSQYISSIMSTVRLQYMTLKEIHSLANEAPELMSSQSKADLLNACWFLSSKQEHLPHQLGDVQIPANRVKIVELRREAGRNVMDDENDVLMDSYSTLFDRISPRRSQGDATNEDTENDDADNHEEKVLEDSNEKCQVVNEKGAEEWPALPELPELPDPVDSLQVFMKHMGPIVSPSEKELEMRASEQILNSFRKPSIGTILPTLKSYLAGKNDSTLILIGGYDPTRDQDSISGLTMFCLNEGMRGFSLRGLLPRGRIHHTTEYLDQKIFVIGGLCPIETVNSHVCPLNTVFVYDLKTDEWTEGTPLNTARSHHGSCHVDDSIYAIGGQDKTLNVLASVERYDLNTNTWTEVAPMPEDRLGPCAVTLKGQIYVIGGCGNGMDYYLIYDSVLSYDPEIDMWTKIFGEPNIPGRCYASASVDKERIWVAGGMTPSRSLGHPLCCSLGLVESYDPSVGLWTPAKELCIQRHHCTSVVFDGCLYVVGGLSTLTSTATRIVEIYDIEKKRWREHTELPRPLMSGHVLVVPPFVQDT